MAGNRLFLLGGEVGRFRGGGDESAESAEERVDLSTGQVSAFLNGTWRPPQTVAEMLRATNPPLPPVTGTL